MVVLHLLPRAPDGEVRSLARSLAMSEVLASVLWQRGHRDPEAARRWLAPSVEAIADPYLFADMEKAVRRIRDAIERREPILVHGDYDVDGLSGTVLLLSFLELVGAEVDYHIPSREDGYSFSEPSLSRIRDGGFRVCISVDSGTAAIDEVGRIQAGGCDVIVTDHHHAGPDVAPAFATLNPRLPDSGYPFPHLAGCAVAFKLAWAIAASFSRRHILADELRAFLVDAASLVALGSVADVVPLVGENRILVRTGLKALLQSASPGIRALMDCLGPGTGTLTAEDISFRIGPRLNAAGRVGHASLAVRLLRATSYGEARRLASELETLNRKRQKIEAEIAAEAVDRVEGDAALREARVLVVAAEGWHIGVLGIVAARLADRYRRPALVLSVAGGRARGSGRSHGGLDLAALLRRASGPLSRFGGHPAAVGVELDASRLPELRAALAAAAASLPPVPEVEVEVDAPASLAHWTTGELRRLADFHPFGQGNPPPTFVATGVRIGAGLRRVGPDRRGLVFTALHDGAAVRAVAPWLGPRIEDLLARRAPWTLAYTPRLAARANGSPIEVLVRAIEA